MVCLVADTIQQLNMAKDRNQANAPTIRNKIALVNASSTI